MTQLKNPMEIFKLLNKSNCQKCGEKTCLAFAAAVFKGEKKLSECPELDDTIVAKYEDKVEKIKTIEDEQREALDALKQRIKKVDLAEAAQRVGGKYENNKLTIKIFGKDFHIHSDGHLSSDIHINQWIVIPVFHYILNCKGVPIKNKWVPFRELKGGISWQNFFIKQCEKPIKEIADTYTELFEDLIQIFNGRPVEHHYESDIAVALHPLPKIPMLVCYWKPEDDLDSDLNLFFDESAEQNSSIEAIYALGTGIVRMFQKLAMRHGIG